MPSKANVADTMTRPDRYHELQHGLGGRAVTEYAFEYPPMGESIKAMRASMRGMRGLERVE